MDRSQRYWWRYVPPSRRRQLARELLWLDSMHWLKRRDVRISLAMLIYGLLCCIPLTLGQPVLAGIALLPALLVPAVGYLAYWLTWKDYHH
jgi:hypothetical protein